MTIICYFCFCSYLQKDFFLFAHIYVLHAHICLGSQCGLSNWKWIKCVQPCTNVKHTHTETCTDTLIQISYLISPQSTAKPAICICPNLFAHNQHKKLLWRSDTRYQQWIRFKFPRHYLMSSALRSQMQGVHKWEKIEHAHKRMYKRMWNMSTSRKFVFASEWRQVLHEVPLLWVLWAF